jgi:8-oxo-dGTP pyrophosphatase MutT (NUDIX family)
VNRAQAEQPDTMKLQIVEELLRTRLKGTLPGLQAQLRFAPRALRTRTAAVPARVAAGLILLYPIDGEAVVPLTLRAEGLARHAGQISLPGGASDPGETVVETALREAREEIGIDPSSLRIIGALTPLDITVSGFTLHPIVAATDARPAFTAAPEEVAAVLEVPLAHLRDASRIRSGTLVRDGVTVEYPYFDLDGHQVWGATAMVLSELTCLFEAG